MLDTALDICDNTYSGNKELSVIDVEITGGIKRNRVLAEEIIWWCMDYLMPRHRTLDIILSFTKTAEDGAYGFCYRGDDDREYFIEIDHRLHKKITKEEYIETIIHQMVHVWQGATGRMKDKFRGGYKQLWKCKDGKYRDYTKTAYMRQPWETEAYRLQGPLTKLFMKEYGYE